MPAEISQQSFAVVRDPESPPPGLTGSVVAIGNFDGVHRGHATVIDRARILAARLGRPAAALTFEPHPADFFARRSVIFRLTPEPAKALALARLGLDGMIEFTFDTRLASLRAEDFIAEILVRRVGVAGVVVGYDFHFGKGRLGTPAALVEAGQKHGFAVEVVEKVTHDEAGSLTEVNSTRIRQALEQGDVVLAERLLGHSYFIVGTVIEGAKLGRRLGFPTANVLPDPSCRLRHGIYAVRLVVDGHTHAGVASYGRRPTFDNGAVLLETFIFDFAGDLYGKTVEIDFVGWIRPEEKFSSADALVAEIHRDIARAKAILAEATP
ncbi:MAG TPA: bifunctional riboflavin kinase/FAD synthetase [Beijerinckiaceae bacterium]|jgi:riboflavin kinase/FMN adenylyltransferase|nr:bifunctional riboflavin kinase/FAD synthetase [Beijerinckiaceae bacterium]